MNVIVLVSACMCNKGLSLLYGQISYGMLQKCPNPNPAAMSPSKISLLRASFFNILANIIKLSLIFL